MPLPHAGKKGTKRPGGLAAFLSKKKQGTKKPPATGASMFKGIRP